MNEMVLFRVFRFYRVLELVDSCKLHVASESVEFSLAFDRSIKAWGPN